MPREANLAPVELELMPGVVDSEILRLSGLLESVTVSLAASIQKDAEAETTWKVAEAASLLKSEKKSEDMRKAEALYGNRELYVKAGVAKATRDALNEKSRALRMRIEALRTLAASLRAQT